MPQKRIAVIPVLRKGKKLRIYLVTSRDMCKWIIPTGKHEKHLTDRQVALLEAYEEAGVEGHLDKSFCQSLNVRSPSGRKKRKTKLYLIEVNKQLKKWPEKKQRRRKLVTLEQLDDFVCDKKLSKKIRSHLSY
jgi:8-oxo-dGTP pyrophosphatase MutT (NUDIX family)